ncbi:MAG: tRNA (guanosine(37)-N1)-methyltransferase TrmD [Chloroflexi bacterium]|nr:tRNA (guanosine(37)-N1)-methyltransferase TrmD [Chloroflexota bacterium]
MRFDILTIFPAMFDGPLSESILGRAREAGHIEVHLHDLRDWAHDRHRTVDDYPFGGGAGMVMKPEPLFEAIEAITGQADPPPYRIFLTPQGRRLDRALVNELAERERLLMICGRYEGVDERVLEHAVDLEISIGDFVVSGGELPAMLLLDAVARRVPGVLGSEGSLDEESFDHGLLEYPQYTRPAEYRDMQVPAVLLSGDHGAVDAWRRARRIERTVGRRPDLLEHAELTGAERRALLDDRGLGDPGMAQRRVGETLFIVRVAAVAVHEGKVLLHRTVGSDVWSLPGGRLLVGERVEETLRREMREEADMKVEPGEVLWVDENFFEAKTPLDSPGRGETLRHHEIGFYVAATVPARFTRRESFGGRELAGTPHEFALEFRWVAPDEFDSHDIRPTRVVGALREQVGNTRR